MQVSIIVIITLTFFWKLIKFLPKTIKCRLNFLRASYWYVFLAVFILFLLFVYIFHLSWRSRSNFFIFYFYAFSFSHSCIGNTVTFLLLLYFMLLFFYFIFYFLYSIYYYNNCNCLITKAISIFSVRVFHDINRYFSLQNWWTVRQFMVVAVRIWN